MTTSMKPPADGETIEEVRDWFRQKMEKIQTLVADIEFSKKRKNSRRVFTGQLEIARQRGARLSLTRKDKTEEYIASPRLIWVYDHHEKEALFIPSETPIVGPFIGEAFRLNLLLAADHDTLRLIGTEEIDGEPCWVVEGKSPRKLKTVGVPVSEVRVWLGKSDGVPRKIGIPDAKDTVILLQKVAVNSPVESSRFEWSPPKGVKQKNIFGF